MTFFKPTTKAILTAVDRQSNIYFTDSLHRIHRFSEKDTNQYVFSPSVNTEFTHLDVWNGISILAFSRGRQEATLLDRFLVSKSTFSIPSQLVGFQRVICNAADNNYWLIDDSDYSLKKYHNTLGRIIENNPLALQIPDKHYNFTSIREYQNNLFLVNEDSSLLLFDNFGNYKREIPTPGITQLVFHNNSILYLDENMVIRMDLYDGHMNRLALPKGIEAHRIEVTSSSLFVFSTKGIYKCQIPVSEP